MSDEKNSPTDEIVGSTVELDGKIQEARENLERILAKFNGSENHKQIRMLRKRILKKLLNEQANCLTPNKE